MIIINGEAKSPAEVEKMYGVPLDKMRKSSEFAINEIMKGYDLGSRQKRTFGGVRFPASFTTEDKDGRSIEIIYAKSKTKSKDKDGRFTDVYSPKKVGFSGDIHIPDSIDLSIYTWLNPKCKQSPFRREDSPLPFTYEFVDKADRASVSIKRGDVMLEALQHAKSVTGVDLKMIAKGLNIENVDGKDELEIQADLSNLAMQNPADYLKKIGTQVTQLNGRIIDAIDKGIFVLKNTFGINKWEWNAGKNKGSMICEVTNSTVSTQDFLITHIKNGNINSFYSEIINLQTNVEADMKAEAFMSQLPKEAVIEKPLVEIPDFDEDKLPANFQEAVVYLTARDGKRPSNKDASQFLKETIEKQEAEFKEEEQDL